MLLNSVTKKYSTPRVGHMSFGSACKCIYINNIRLPKPLIWVLGVLCQKGCASPITCFGTPITSFGTCSAFYIKHSQNLIVGFWESYTADYTRFISSFEHSQNSGAHSCY